MSDKVTKEDYEQFSEFGITDSAIESTNKNLSKINKISQSNMDKHIIEFNEYLEDHNIHHDRTRITEVLFEEEFVKFFYALLTTKDLKTKSVLLYSETGTKWNKISKGWKEVDVINENKEVIYTVPGLFGYIRPKEGVFDIMNEDGSREKVSLTDIMTKYESMGPGLKAVNFLEEQFERINAIDEIVESDKEKYIEMWIKIFKRYPDIIGVKVKEEIPKEEKKDKDVITEADLDWW